MSPADAKRHVGIGSASGHGFSTHAANRGNLIDLSPGSNMSVWLSGLPRAEQSRPIKEALILKNIHPLLTGDLLAILADMGHGDELVIADANFPADALAQRLVRLPGISVTTTLDAVLGLLPLDDSVDAPAAAMDAPGGRPELYSEFDRMLARAEGREIPIELIERFDFYDRTRQSYAVIATGERRLYGNIILTKGVLRT